MQRGRELIPGLLKYQIKNIFERTKKMGRKMSHLQKVLFLSARRHFLVNSLIFSYLQRDDN